MSYIIIKKNNLQMIELLDNNLALQYTVFADLISKEDLELFLEQEIDPFKIGFEYQNNNLYYKICATKEEAELVR